jgi:plastocyanin
MLLRRHLIAAFLMIVTAPLISAATAAKEHTIIILQSSFFPAHVSVEDGDLIRFVNASGHEQTVIGAQNTWTTGILPAGSETVFAFEPAMLGTFFSDEAGTFQGTLSLSAP